MSLSRKLTLLIVLFGTLFLLGLKVYKKIFAYEKYPNGQIKKSAVWIFSKNMYRIKEYYENGNIEAIYYKKNLTTEGKMYIYTADGKLKALNYFKGGKMYYKKVYKYNSNNKLIDSAYSIMPLVYEKKRDIAADSVYYKVGVITDGLNISCDSLDLFYELYEYKAPDGRFPYTPSHVAPLKNCNVQDLRLSTKPDMIRFTDIKSDSLYFFVLVRDRSNGKIHENDPVIIPMNK